MFYFIFTYYLMKKYVTFRYFDQLKITLKIIQSREKYFFKTQSFMVKGNNFSVSTYKPIFVMEI